MAISYWDYWRDTGTSTTGGNFWSDIDTSNSTSTSATYDGQWVYATATHYVRKVRKILVKAPSKWGKAIRAAYTRLVNDETNTGWKVTMWIKGKIDITDPDVEVRSMEDFIPLLKSRASPSDRRMIDDFFDEFGYA